MKKPKLKLEYRKEIIEIPLKKIEINSYNPRKRFVQSEEDELIASLLQKGILNPIIVYKKKNVDKYVILDGERRFRALTKLNTFPKVPAHILIHEPNVVDNLSMMFHIHNVREEWTDFAISMSLARIVTEMGKDIRKLDRQDKKELEKLTSLSIYQINKYLIFQQYPDAIIKRFLKAELSENPPKGMDPDILAEMNKPIKKMEKIMPEIYNIISKTKMIEACIRKKAKNIIKNNREFRFLNKSLTAAEKDKVRIPVIEENMIEFFKNVSISPEAIYMKTSDDFFRFSEIISKSELLSEKISNLDMNRLRNEEKQKLKKELIALVSIIQNKFHY